MGAPAGRGMRHEQDLGDTQRYDDQRRLRREGLGGKAEGRSTKG